MQNKLVLIDGNSIINRAFYGIPMLTNNEGIHTNAIYGFLNIMFKILEEEAPGYLAIAFDLKAPTFRHKMYDEYKGTRKPMPDELKEQVPILKELLSKMQICIMEQAGFEADDLLGTMAKRAEAEGFDVALVSGDRDLLQIATERIKIRIPKTKGGKTEVEDYYASDVLEKYRLEPLQIIELKALMGDSSDNIPGVPKSGEKTATELLVQYHDIENLREHIPEITKKSIRETLENHFDMAVMSKTLATICIDADTGVSIEDTELKNIYTPQAYELIKSLGFKQIAKRFEEAGAAGDVSEVSSELAEKDVRGLKELLEGAGQRVGFFIITDDKNSATGLSLCLSNEKTYHFAFADDGQSQEALSCLCDIIRAEDKDILFVTYGLKKQLHVMNEVADIDINYAGRFSDIEIADYLLNPLLKDYSVDTSPEMTAYAAYGNYEGSGKRECLTCIMK